MLFIVIPILNCLSYFISNDRAKALDILIKDLKVFSLGHEELFKEMTQLLTINNIRSDSIANLLILDMELVTSLEKLNFSFSGSKQGT